MRILCSIRQSQGERMVFRQIRENQQGVPIFRKKITCFLSDFITLAILQPPQIITLLL